MKRVTRFLSGGLFGAALLTLGIAVSPQPASATSDGFCDETQNYICCCSTGPGGQIYGCNCATKPPIRAA